MLLAIAKLKLLLPAISLERACAPLTLRGAEIDCVGQGECVSNYVQWVCACLWDVRFAASAGHKQMEVGRFLGVLANERSGVTAMHN